LNRIGAVHHYQPLNGLEPIGAQAAAILSQRSGFDFKVSEEDHLERYDIDVDALNLEGARMELMVTEITRDFITQTLGPDLKKPAQNVLKEMDRNIERYVRDLN
jgi:hypothetical protein